MFGLASMGGIDMIPAGTVQDMVREHGPGLLTMIMRSAAINNKLDPAERMGLLLVEHVKDGKPVVMCFPMALQQDLDVSKARQLPYYNLNELLATYPIADKVRELKAGVKLMDKYVAKVQAWQKAAQAGDKEKSAKLWAEAVEIKRSMPPMVRAMIEEATRTPPPKLAAPAQEPFRLETGEKDQLTQQETNAIAQATQDAADAEHDDNTHSGNE